MRYSSREHVFIVQIFLKDPVLVILIGLLPKSSPTAGVLGSLDMVRKVGWCLVDRGMKLMGNLGTQGDRMRMDMD